MEQKATNKIIHDRAELARFLSYFPEPENDEVYFLSLSARNKYLTDEERVEFDLGRTEMFSRHTAFDKAGIEMAIARMESDLAVRTTRNGSDIPHKCLVTYFNIHPASTIEAYTNFKKQLDHHFNETFNAIRNEKTANYEPFIRSRTHLMNHIQKSRSRRIFVDIDIDCKDGGLAHKAQILLTERLFEYSIGYLLVFTQGGVHILIDREALNHHNKTAPKGEKVELHNLLTKAHKIVEPLGGEAVFNKNAMVPLPGTYQAGVPVKFDDFGTFTHSENNR